MLRSADLQSYAHQRPAAFGTAELQRAPVDLLHDLPHHGEEIRACEEDGITTFVPKPQTSNSKADGRFGKQGFVYIAQDDEYRCPAGQRLIKHYTTVEHGMTLHC